MVADDEQSARGRLMAFCDRWREKGWLHESIRPGFFSQRFKVRDGITRKEFVVSLVAVRLDALGLRAGEAEEERRRYPRLRHLKVEGVASREVEHGQW